MLGEGNMETGIEVEVPGKVISGYGNGSQTKNYVSICDKKGETLRNSDGTVLDVYIIEE